MDPVRSQEMTQVTGAGRHDGRPFEPSATRVGDANMKISGFELQEFLAHLEKLKIQAQKIENDLCPPQALMHDRAAVVPALVVSPSNEKEVVEVLKLLKKLHLYRREVSVKSGGHGYFNGGTCSDIMLDLSSMTQRRVEEDILFLEPGCVLGQTIDLLSKHKKVVPHGDCFGVGAGGHFLTAGWDLLLSRCYGLGCQSVIGGRVILWDGTVKEVDEERHRDLLYAMRGGAAAGVGIVTEIRLRLEKEPTLVTWRFTPITKEQMMSCCVAYGALGKATSLPREISVSFRFHFEPGQHLPTCSFNIVSLLSTRDTIEHLDRNLGPNITSLVSDVAGWYERPLIDLRLVPGSDALLSNPGMLADINAQVLQRSPETFWSQKWCKREMARSYFTSVSHWVMPACEAMFPALYAAFESAKDQPWRERMSALVVLGGGRMLELPCSMPLGRALARFEQHWDDPGTEEQACRDFTEKISKIIQEEEDPMPYRTYRGDIWKQEQADDLILNNILGHYDKRGV